jgi:hypothetical protein
MANRPKVIDDADYLVPESGLEAFYNKVRAMAREEFGVDADGDSLVQISLTDRTRYWGNQYFLIAYDHKAKTEEEHEAILRDLLTNLEIATKEVRQRFDIRRYKRNEAKRAAANKGNPNG